MGIIPTLLTTNPLELKNQIALFQSRFSRIQIDVADGKLVPNITTSVHALGEMLENGLSINKGALFDFHLMVEDYNLYVDEISSLLKFDLKVNLILINSKHNPDCNKLTENTEFKIGLDIFPEEKIKNIAHNYDLNKIPTIQIMTVKPGFQGSPFLPEMLNKIDELRNVGYSGEIIIDGGVNDKTYPVIKSSVCLPDNICVGSYLTRAGDDLDNRIKTISS